MSEIYRIRKKFGLSQRDFALLLGYLGHDRNNETRVKRLELEEEPHLLLLRFLWMVECWFDEHDGTLPYWPEHLRIEGTLQPWM